MLLDNHLFVFSLHFFYYDKHSDFYSEDTFFVFFDNKWKIYLTVIFWNSNTLIKANKTYSAIKHLQYAIFMHFLCTLTLIILLIKYWNNILENISYNILFNLFRYRIKHPIWLPVFGNLHVLGSGESKKQKISMVSGCSSFS